MRAAWLYDPQLDVVVVAPGGRLAGRMIAWYDPRLRVAEIEPLGVAPEHRRKRLASAMCLEAASRIRQRGGEQLYVNVGPNELTQRPR